MADISVLIGIDSSKASVADVAAELATHGLRITGTMPITGVISGEADATKLDDLSHVHGVRTVRQEGRVQLPPVHEDIPQ
jgi:hypothetical protein